MKIGFIGLGIMGSSMAYNLIKHKVPLLVHNRTQAKAQPLLQMGALWAERPSDVSAATILFTMLADPAAVHEVALGTDGFLAQMRPGTLWVDCSTVHPRFSRKMAQEAARRDVRFIDAPVAGTKPQAEQAQLVFFAGASDADLAECRPYLDMMGQRVVHAGEQGTGIAIKVVINSLLAAAMATFSESMALGQALGLEEEMLLELLIGGPVTTPFVAAKREKMVTANYEPQFPLKLMHKDLQMVAEAAQDVEAAVPLAAATRARYAAAMEQGLGEKDFSAIYAFYNAKG